MALVRGKDVMRVPAVDAVRLRDFLNAQADEIARLQATLLATPTDLVTARAELATLRAALEVALVYLDRGKPEAYENHHCGPESACDQNCADVAAYGMWRHEMHALTTVGAEGAG